MTFTEYNFSWIFDLFMLGNQISRCTVKPQGSGSHLEEETLHIVLKNVHFFGCPTPTLPLSHCMESKVNSMLKKQKVLGRLNSSLKGHCSYEIVG